MYDPYSYPPPSSGEEQAEGHDAAVLRRDWFLHLVHGWCRTLHIHEPLIKFRVDASH